MIEPILRDAECEILNKGAMKSAESDLRNKRYRESNSLRNSLILRASKSQGLKAQVEYVNGEIKKIFCTNLPDPYGTNCNLGGQCIYR